MNNNVNIDQKVQVINQSKRINKKTPLRRHTISNLDIDISKFKDMDENKIADENVCLIDYDDKKTAAKSQINSRKIVKAAQENNYEFNKSSKLNRSLKVKKKNNQLSVPVNSSFDLENMTSVNRLNGKQKMASKSIANLLISANQNDYYVCPIIKPDTVQINQNEVSKQTIYNISPLSTSSISSSNTSSMSSLTNSKSNQNIGENLTNVVTNLANEVGSITSTAKITNQNEDTIKLTNEYIDLFGSDLKQIDENSTNKYQTFLKNNMKFNYTFESLI